MIQHLTAIWKYRHFLLALIRLDLRLRYRRSVFGIGWSLLNPIAMTVVFCLVFSGLMGNGNWRAYSTYLLAGMAVWGFLRDSTLAGCRALLANESYIRQSPLPFGLYTLRTVAGQAIHSLIAMAVVVVMASALLPGGLNILQGPPLPSGLTPGGWRTFEMVPIVLPGLLLAFVAAWAVATIMAFANVYFQDTQHLLDVGAQIMFFLTPIIYEADQLRSRGMNWVIDLNPVSLYLGLIRDPLLTGQAPSLTLFAQGAGFTALLVGLAFGVVGWLQKRVIFHL